MAVVQKRSHERLRIPEQWKGQDRQFVIQLERILDDVYNGKADAENTKQAIASLTASVESLDSNKLDKSKVYNGLDKTASGFALDARQGKTLADRKLNYYQLLAKTELTGSYAIANTFNSRQFSDYEFIAIYAYRGNWIMGCVSVARSHFTDSDGIAILSWNGSTQIEYDVKYVSDTSVSMKKITSDSGTQYVRIIGLRWD